MCAVCVEDSSNFFSRLAVCVWCFIENRLPVWGAGNVYSQMRGKNSVVGLCAILWLLVSSTMSVGNFMITPVGFARLNDQ